MKKVFFVSLALIFPGLLWAKAPNLDFSHQELKTRFELVQSAFEQTIEDITNQDFSTATYQSTARALDTAFANYYDNLLIANLYSAVHPQKNIRDLCQTWSLKVSQTGEEVFQNQALYAIMDAIKTDELNSQEERLLDNLLIDFKANGLGLEGKDARRRRKKLAQLQKKITKIEDEFDKNIQEFNVDITLTAEEQTGLPERMFNGQRDGKTVIWPLTVNVYLDILKFAANESVRKRAHELWHRRAPKNIKVLKRLLTLRDKVADIFKGHPSYAHYKLGTSNRIASSPEEVQGMLSTLAKDLATPYQSEREDFRKIKCHYVSSCNLSKGEHKSIQLAPWDRAYYSRRYVKDAYDLDIEKIKAYFPMQKVVQGTFDIYSALFGIDIQKEPSAKLWHEDVSLYRISDAKTHDVLGYFAFDPYPRPNKFKHYAAFSIRLAHGTGKPAERSVPIAALVGNFPKPSKQSYKGKTYEASLNGRQDVETFFHEFGHITHALLSQADNMSLSSMMVPLDFVEAPSQMLENWAFDHKALQKLSGHYATGGPLPKPEFDKLKQVKNFGQAHRYLRQVFLATVDLVYHYPQNSVMPYKMGKRPSTTMLWHDLWKKILLDTPDPKNHYQTAFGHLTGYDVGYYGYLWSEVYAQDMFSRFDKEGLFSKQAGRDYRKEILEMGNARPVLESVKAFLGREPNAKAFIKTVMAEKPPLRL